MHTDTTLAITPTAREDTFLLKRNTLKLLTVALQFLLVASGGVSDRETVKLKCSGSSQWLTKFLSRSVCISKVRSAHMAQS